MIVAHLAALLFAQPTATIELPRPVAYVQSEPPPADVRRCARCSGAAQMGNLCEWCAVAAAYTRSGKVRALTQSDREHWPETVQRVPSHMERGRYRWAIKTLRRMQHRGGEL